MKNIYDRSGNVTADPQGSMTLAWNVLDLPRTLTSGSASTQRAYLADGSLAQVSSGTSYRLYLGDLVFTRTGTTGTPVLESAAWEGGRLISGSGTGNVLYHVTDHLGSVRVVKDGAGTVRQRFDYYPYGSVSRVYTNSSTTDNSVKRYRFGGKEIAGTALTDLAGTGAAPGAPYLDFGARLYSPGTATWLSVDPMAEKYYGIGPLTYCAGNPVNLMDPTGRKLVVRDSSEGLATEYEWKEVGEVWGFFNVDGKAYSGSNEYILSLTDALSTLMEGKAGCDMINEIAERPETILVGLNKEQKNKYYPNLRQVSWNPNVSKIGAPFLSLGHELAHAMDDLRGTMNNSIWIPAGEINGYVSPENVLYNEIFSTHVENQIRKEHELPLRNAYLSTDNSNSPAFVGPPIIDRKGRSIYFNTLGNTNYKYVKAANRFIY